MGVAPHILDLGHGAYAIVGWDANQDHKPKGTIGNRFYHSMVQLLKSCAVEFGESVNQLTCNRRQ